MADPKDIRRQVGDVSPNNYINPGVQDTSTASLISGLGGTLLEADKQHALGTFGESIETLRTLEIERTEKSIEALRNQYIVGKTPQEAASAPSVVDEEQPDPEADYVPTAQDKKSLADFGATLDAHAQAVEQGVRSQDMFRIAAERLYRTAISKRPGLAREFRGIAEQFLGFDVVGASLDILGKQEEEYIKSLANKAKTAEEHSYELYKNDRARMEALGFSDAASVPFEQWASWKEANKDHINQVAVAVQAAQLAKDQTTLLDLQGKKSESADTELYITQMGSISAGYRNAINDAMTAASTPDANGRRLIDSPQGMREVVTGLRNKLLANVDQVEKVVAGRQVASDTKTRYRARVDEDLAKLESVLSLKDDSEFQQRAISMLQAAPQIALLSDPETALMAAMNKQIPVFITDSFIAKNGKELGLHLAKIFTDQMPPNQGAKIGDRVISQLIGTVWPEGSKTPPDVMATSKAAEGIAKTLSFYYLQDDANFRPQDFTAWQGREGILPMLTQRAPQITKSLSDDEKGQIATQIAAASGNSALRLMSLLQKKAPSLVAKLDYASVWKADTPGLAKVKPGQTLSPAEQQVLDHFGKQFNRDIITKAMQAYAGGGPQDVWLAVAQQVKPTLDIKQELSAHAISQSASQTVQNAAGGAPAEGADRGVQGPAPGTVVGGYRYKGGDPNSQTSWEKVQ